MRALAAAVLLILALAAVPSLAAETIVVNGSATIFPVMEKLAEAYRAAGGQAHISVSGGGSGNGIKALIDGYAGIAMSSRELKEGEIAAAKARGLTLAPVPMAKDAVCAVVHPDNQVSDLSLKQLRDVFSGKITNWKELGGVPGPIVVVARDTSSGTAEAWRELVMGETKISPKALRLLTSGAVLQAVAKSRAAIGYEGFCYTGDTVKAVSVEGVRASLDPAVLARYKLSRTLWLISADPPSPGVRRFLDFILSPAGQDIVAAGKAAPVAPR